MYTDPEGSRGSQIIYPPDPDDEFDDPLSRYWWCEGNMSNDRNRARFVGMDMDDFPPGSYDIFIDFVQPVDPGLPTLVLLESLTSVLYEEDRFQFEELKKSLNRYETKHVTVWTNEDWGNEK